MESKPCFVLGCENFAVARITYFIDDNGAKTACRSHVVRAMEEVSKAANLYGTETLRITPLGTVRKRIQLYRKIR